MAKVKEEWGRCEACNQEMSKKVKSCKPHLIPTKYGNLKPIPFGKEHRFGNMPQTENCPDCNVKIGGCHHPGCDWEECPHCHSQILGCSCLISEEK